MKSTKLCRNRQLVAGFTLPVVLVITGVLLILSVGVLMVTNTERSTARSLVEHQRADLAAKAGLEAVREILKRETTTDDFIILQSTRAEPITNDRVKAPHLFLARGKVRENQISFCYIPLFSSVSAPDENQQLAAPRLETISEASESHRMDFTALPYQDKVSVSWRPIHDEKGRAVARYAWWLEDLQGKADPRLTGNTDGPDHTHVRAAFPYPAPGLNPKPDADNETPLNQIAIYAIDSKATSDDQGVLEKSLINNRSIMVSPGSLLAAAKIKPPLSRDNVGHLIDRKARSTEENLVTNLQPYFERPLIPPTTGIDPSVIGTPRMNLNSLLAEAPGKAVDKMASFINNALPDFEKRKGGFPENYIMTLAANSIDYADADSDPTLMDGNYRGLDAYPLMSEIALKIQYVGISNQHDRKIMTFRFKLFAELFNPTSKPVKGDARLSYEVALPMSGIGAGVGGVPFDSPSLISAACVHNLLFINDRFWSDSVEVNLQPNQYFCYLFADAIYSIDVGASTDIIPNGTPFSLDETKGISGVSLMWNNHVVERSERIIRQAGLNYSMKNGVLTGGFSVGTTKTLTKAALPGHVYDDYPNMYYNMGDPRITHYLRSAFLDENAYPENASPNRRNIRLDIYKNDAANKPKVYARMLPSEWPDGGHNAPVGSWSNGTNDGTELTAAKFDFAYDPEMGKAAPQVISNLGRFLSTTELGRVFDPIMHAPTFINSEDTDLFRNKGKYPSSSATWPDVISDQPSSYYGGGNTLRIGRPEHPAFVSLKKPGLHAVRLLDLFHVGRSRSDDALEREGPVIRIEGHVNLNTATRDTIRAMAAGNLVMDPLLAKQTDTHHSGAPFMAPPVSPLTLQAPSITLEADRIADAIIGNRPYISAADLANIKDLSGEFVFGNRAMYPDEKRVEWSDAAAEEVFARVYEASTVRSRNFRVWIVAQSLAPSSNANSAPTVLSEVRKVHNLFVDPGERALDGAIINENCKTIVNFTNEF